MSGRKRVATQVPAERATAAPAHAVLCLALCALGCGARSDLLELARGDAGADAGCVPSSCVGRCGPVEDGCGGTLDCGSCAAASRCGTAARRRDADHKLVFVTSTYYLGDLGGLAGADAKCQARADAAGLPGAYCAWLSDRSTSASSRLDHAAVPYVRVDGTPIASDWADLTDGEITATLNVDELGNTAPSRPVTWSNTNADGSTQSPSLDCDGWSTTASPYTGGLARNDRTDEYWAGNGWFAYDCGHPDAPLYCFEQ